MCLTVLVATSCGSEESRAAAPEPQAGDQPPGTLDPAQPEAGPQLSLEDRARAERITMADPRVQELIAGDGSSVTNVGGWWTKGNRSIIGAGLEIVFDPPLRDVDRTWVLIDYDETETTSPPYRVVEMRYPASELRSVMVRVDFDRNAVVGLEPGPGSVAQRPDRPQ